MSTRTAALWVPDWPVAAALAVLDIAPHQPVAIMGHHGVLAASAGARAAGVRRGMRKRTAQARCPELVLVPRDLDRDAAQFEPVAVAAESVVAGLEVLRPGLALLPAEGAARYYGSDDALAAELVEAVSLAGFESQVGIADGLLAAVIAARDQVVVPPGVSAEFLAPRPVAALESALPASSPDLEEAISLWQRLGLRTLGDIAALSPSSMAGRFGSLGVWAQRLAQGEDLRPPAARRVEEEVLVAVELEPPAYNVAQASQNGDRLAEQFAALMAERGLACGRIRISARTESGLMSRVWRTDAGALGGMPAAQIGKRIRWQLDGWLTASSLKRGNDDDGGADDGEGPSPVHSLEIAAEDVTSAGEYQMGLWGNETGHDQRARRALHRAQGLLGLDQVLAVRLQGGRVPAEREARWPFGEASPDGRPLDQPWPGALPDPAPTRVFREPIPAQLAGETLTIGALSEPVRTWAGPWVVPQNWWEVQAASATYLQAVTESSVYLLRETEAGWEAVAQYD